MLCCGVDFADKVRLVEVTVVPIIVDSHIKVADVALFQLVRVRYSVTNDLVIARQRNGTHTCTHTEAGETHLRRQRMHRPVAALLSGQRMAQSQDWI